MNILISAIVSVVIVAGGFIMTDDKYGGKDIFGAISYPTSLDTFTNPSATDQTNSPSHATQHSNANDSIEALQAKVGIDGSAVNTSHDFKLSGVSDGDFACSLTGTETLTNKTLTSPNMTGLVATTSTFNTLTTLNDSTQINDTLAIDLGSDAEGDLLYRDSGGDITRLGIGSANQFLRVAGGVPTWNTFSPTNAAAVYSDTSTGGATAHISNISIDAADEIVIWATFRELSDCAGGDAVVGNLTYKQDTDVSTTTIMTVTNEKGTTGACAATAIGHFTATTTTDIDVAGTLTDGEQVYLIVQHFSI